MFLLLITMMIGDRMNQITSTNDFTFKSLDVPHLPIVLLIDTSDSMEEHIDKLSNSINKFINNLRQDEENRNRIDVAVIGIGEETTIIQDFISVAKMEPVKLQTHGTVFKAFGIIDAIDLVKQYLKLFNSIGTPIFKPWIIIFTNSPLQFNTRSEFESIKETITKEETKGGYGRFKWFTVTMQNADRKTIYEMTNRIIEMNGPYYENFFEWLYEALLSQIIAQAQVQIGLLPPLPEMLHVYNCTSENGD